MNAHHGADFLQFLLDGPQDAHHRHEPAGPERVAAALPREEVGADRRVGVGRQVGLRRRIGAVRNIKQITRAMQFVAASKLRRAQDATLSARSYSDKIDEVLARHGAVSEAVAFGVPHPTWGEEVAAAVVLTEPVSEKDLIRHCREHLADFKVPRHVYIVDAIPRTPTGKIQRRAVAESLTGSPP